MQTIGKTTNKMDFPKTWTDILLKSISGKTNYTIDVKIGTKRITTDNQDQRESPKKRRKQSNPTRISANEENLNHEHDTESLQSDRNKHEFDQIESPKDLRLSKNQKSFSLPLNLTTCESQKLSLDGSQQIQYSNNMYQQNDSSTEISKNLSSPYQPFMQSIPYFEKKHCYSVEYSSFKSPPCNSAANAGPTSVQIFNPEAFCDQCNKEFCNKYFLKTHKANKHGVFLENVPSAGSTLDQTDRYKEPPVATTSDFSSNTNDASAVASTSTLFKNTLVYPQPSVNASMYASKNMVNNQTRAFCNICQKEFCNKYFVKRHKAKIHGIIDDGDYKTTIDDVPLNFKMNLQIKNELIDLCNPDYTFDKDGKAGSPIFYVQESNSQVSKTHTQSHTSVNIEGPELQSVVVETPCDHIKTEVSDDEHCANHNTNKPPDECYNGMNCYDSGALASDPTRVAYTNGDRTAMRNHVFSKPSVETVLQQPVERTKVLDLMAKSNGECGIGKADDNDDDDEDDDNDDQDYDRGEDVLGSACNVENDGGTAGTEDGARVELIGKVKLLTLHNLFFKLNGGALENTSKCYVCNTTVDGPLKAHIFDKHEHLVNELMNDSLRCEWTGGAKGAGGASTSSKNSAENHDECAAARDRNENRKPSAAALSSFCRICNKELCNKYFMKTHMERMHGISIQNGNHIGGVVCDICNKELCSKYFLRVHRLNSHGVGGPENGSRYWPDADNRVGTIAPVEGPSLSQPPPPPPPPPPQPPVEQDDDGHHRYYKHYTESCGVCLRRFRSAKWLSAHLLNDHGDEGRAQWQRLAHHNRPDEDEGQLLLQRRWQQQQQQQQQQDQDAAGKRTEDDAKRYRCSYCPFATSVLSFLFVHEKFHVVETNKAADTVPPPPPPRRAVEPVQPRSPDHRPAVAADLSLDNRGQPIPIGSESSGHEPFIMQSFFLENCSVSPYVKADASGRSDSFHSSLVYLPVKEKLTSTVNVFFKLTPT